MARVLPCMGSMAATQAMPPGERPARTSPTGWVVRMRLNHTSPAAVKERTPSFVATRTDSA